MLRRAITMAMLAALVSLAVVACGGGEAPTPTPTPTRPSPPPPPPPPVATPTVSVPAPSTPTPTPSEVATSFTVNLADAGGPGPFFFKPADLTFSAGETVNFTFIGESQFHTFTVDELDIDVDVGGGETVTFGFTFNKPGTYQLICVPHEAVGDGGNHNGPIAKTCPSVPQIGRFSAKGNARFSLSAYHRSPARR